MVEGTPVEELEMEPVTRTTRAPRTRFLHPTVHWGDVPHLQNLEQIQAHRGYWTIYDTEDQVEKSFSTFEEYQEYLKRTKSKGLVSLEDDLFTA